MNVFVLNLLIAFVLFEWFSLLKKYGIWLFSSMAQREPNILIAHSMSMITPFSWKSLKSDGTGVWETDCDTESIVNVVMFETELKQYSGTLCDLVSNEHESGIWKSIGEDVKSESSKCVNNAYLRCLTDVGLNELIVVRCSRNHIIGLLRSIYWMKPKMIRCNGWTNRGWSAYIIFRIGINMTWRIGSKTGVSISLLRKW